MDADNRIKIYVIDAAGAGPTQVLPHSEILRKDGTTAAIGRVDVSPNGNQLAFAADTSVRASSTCSSCRPTAARRRRTSPAGSPRARRSRAIRSSGGATSQAVAFIATTWGGKREPFVAPVNGSGHVACINIAADNGHRAESVDWSPDGSQMFVVADYLTDASRALLGSTRRPPTQTSRPWCSTSSTAARSFDITLTR